jgi:hypothetical protein
MRNFNGRTPPPDDDDELCCDFHQRSGEGVDCAVDFEGLMMVTQEEVGAGDRSCVGTREVECVNVAM